MRRLLHSLSELSSLFGEPDASARDTKKDAQAEAQARPEGSDMLDIAQSEAPAKGDFITTATPAYSETAPNEVRRIRALLTERLLRASRLSDSDLMSETVEITPAMAQFILDAYNTANRPVSQGRVADYARQMANGDWKLTSQGLAFLRNGKLGDGQHKLHAIVRSGRTIILNVAFGLPDDAFKVLDTGGKRTAGDTLALLGHKQAISLAAAARLLDIVTSKNPLSNASMSNEEVVAVVGQHPRLAEVAAAGAAIARLFRCSSAAPIVAFYLIKRDSKHALRLDEFVARLKDNADQEKRSPVTFIRDGLMMKRLDRQYRSGGNRSAAQAAAIIKAWNKWVRGQKDQEILWMPGEPFPKAY